MRVRERGEFLLEYIWIYFVNILYCYLILFQKTKKIEYRTITELADEHLLKAWICPRGLVNSFDLSLIHSYLDNKATWAYSILSVNWNLFYFKSWLKIIIIISLRQRATLLMRRAIWLVGLTAGLMSDRLNRQKSSSHLVRSYLV